MQVLPTRRPNLILTLVLSLFAVGLTASSFGLGATLSNFLGQMVVEKFGHVASLTGSLVLSVIPLILFCFMPETYGHRGDRVAAKDRYQSLTA